MQISTLSQSLALRNSINDMRAQFDDLQRQLSTGLKTDSYAKLGTNRNTVLSLTHQLGQLSTYTNTIAKSQMRIEVMSTSLSRVNDIVSETKTSMVTSGFDLVNGSQTGAQVQAAMSFDEMVNLLNLQVEDRYLFGGTETQTRPVALPDEIQNGSGDEAGLKQFIDERAQADLGADGLGRLTLGTAGTTVTLAEDADPSVFGFKIADVQSTLTNANVTGPAGSPAGVDVEFTDVPAAGGKISFELDLPDGTSTTVTLTATTNSPPEEGEFTIGGDAATTSANFQAALDTSLKREANVSLKAASAVEAANNFFDYEAGGVPQRVDGPPFDSATGLRDATADDTVFWYSGDLGPNAGKDFTAQIDDGRQLSYGARADQDSIRDTLKMSALLSAVEYNDAEDAEQRDSYRELTARAGQVLNFEGTQSVESIVTNLGLASATLENTQNRHDATMATANEILGDIQNADPYEVGVKLTTLETQLQASYQVTAMLSQLSLVNFI
ncbi:flagellin [Parvibaculum sp.]|uniref:flagellin N-terminal helical domain-containing protein n=1 Tax=Parvibaculum sp. TaxID=2024848 RepID=UPI0032994CC6